MDRQVYDTYIYPMSIQNLWNNIAASIAAIPRSELLMLALAALVGGWIGAMMIRRRVPAGRIVRTASTVVLVGILVTVVLQLSRFDPRLEVAVPQLGLPEQVVEGGETRIPMADDGHFWLRAEINGVPANFLVDTGATVTAVSSNLAAEARLQPRRGGLPISIGTANGPVAAQLATAEEIRFGNVAARGLDVVIAPTLGETNVVGMNLLSRLKSWRVEGQTMVLVPNNPQEPIELR
ncbi:TIGR02281 family clan AA aspartic protease [Altererythrobacter arenosus]|uniref:TIGR02281 family clan AA aspartic protease n=1 Tax=Altererythrobacter arenosus TaxID=3032592 RepID=A0ABY8FTZ3_9SPHN|nr:TIGR02281 family clan AA aspartic protease [Altererythrobacter sp. CAU 1644]WFL76581.1 TIGR02281 family clan AA aspartic protease [Altererythrobacter sp. CAU 1644]